MNEDVYLYNTFIYLLFQELGMRWINVVEIWVKEESVWLFLTYKTDTTHSYASLILRVYPYKGMIETNCWVLPPLVVKSGTQCFFVHVLDFIVKGQ